MQADPGAARHRVDAAGRRSTPRSPRSGAGSASRSSPRARSRSTSSPMAGKSGTARLAAATGVPVTPVGMWGVHRILFKGRKPNWQRGVAETRRRRAGRCASPRTRTCRAATRPHHGGHLPTAGRAGPRDLPAAAAAGTTTGGCGAPETARRAERPRERAREGRGDRRGLLGHRGRGDRGEQRRHGPLGPPARARRRASRAGTRTPTTSPAIELPESLAVTSDARGRVHGRRRRRASASRRTGCRAVLAEAAPVHRSDRAARAACRRGSSRGPCCA